ncbi:MAG: DUF5985 family protein [Candidatus Hydrogenedentes bacterium]|nr:DUF5985 family protein [Candidatus Hydrogenedentota bacterium]
MMQFLSGAIMMASAACGLYFLKSWTMSRDRLFFLFALSFWFLAVERWMLAVVSPENEFRYYVYTFRLIAFAIIVVAILDKNRSTGK